MAGRIRKTCTRRKTIETKKGTPKLVGSSNLEKLKLKGTPKLVGSSNLEKLKLVREWEKELRSVNPGWTDEQIEKQAIFLAGKEPQIIAAKKKLLSTRYT